MGIMDQAYWRAGIYWRGTDSEDHEGFKIARGRGTFKPKMAVDDKSKLVRTMANQWESLQWGMVSKAVKTIGWTPRINHERL